MAVAIKDILEIMRIDPMLLADRVHFADSLETPPDIVYQVNGLTQPYEYFKVILTSWICRNPRNAKLSALISILQSGKYNYSAEKLEQMNGISADDDKEILLAETHTDNMEEYIASIVNIVGKQFHLYLDELRSVFCQAGNRPVVIISLNGRFRVGKSFRVNQFLKYLLNYQTSEYWIREELERCFTAKKSARPVTAGIDVWKTPIIVNAEGTEYAVILMDCQRMFDSKTAITMNAKLFAFSILLSSVFIYCDTKTIKDVLEFLQQFSGIASDLNKKQAESGLLRKFIFQVLDSQIQKQFIDGVYNDKHTPEGQVKNYKKWLTEKDPTLAQSMAQISEDFSIYLMPRPGVIKPDIGVDVSRWDSKFRQHVIGSVESVFSGVDGFKSCVKKIGWMEMTGTTLADYVDVLAAMFSNDGRFPDLKSLMATTGEWQGGALLNQCLNAYISSLNILLLPNEDGTPPEILDAEHTEYKTTALNLFRETKILAEDNLKSALLLKLETKIDEQFTSWKLINADRLQKSFERDILKQQEAADARLRAQHEAETESALEATTASNYAAQLLQQQIAAEKAKTIKIAEDAVTQAKKQLDEAIALKQGAETDKTPPTIRDESRNVHQGTVHNVNERLNQSTYHMNLVAAGKLVNGAEEGVRLAEIRLRNAQI